MVVHIGAKGVKGHLVIVRGFQNMNGHVLRLVTCCARTPCAIGSAALWTCSQSVSKSLDFASFLKKKCAFPQMLYFMNLLLFGLVVALRSIL